MKSMFSKKLVLVALLCFAVCGCGYRVGSVLPSHIKTVRVEAFENKTDQPNLAFDVTEAVKRRIRTDGTLRVVSDEEAADSVLKGVITGYSRKAVVLASDNTTKEYELSIAAELDFEDTMGSVKYDNLAATGKINFYVGIVPAEKIASTRKSRGTRELISASTLPEAEKNARPLAIDDLATNSVIAVVEQGDW